SARQLLVRSAGTLVRRPVGAAALDLLPEKQIVEIHSILCRLREAATAEDCERQMMVRGLQRPAPPGKRRAVLANLIARARRDFVEVIYIRRNRAAPNRLLRPASAAASPERSRASSGRREARKARRVRSSRQARSPNRCARPAVAQRKA